MDFNNAISSHHEAPLGLTVGKLEDRLHSIESSIDGLIPNRAILALLVSSSIAANYGGRILASACGSLGVVGSLLSAGSASGLFTVLSTYTCCRITRLGITLHNQRQKCLIDRSIKWLNTLDWTQELSGKSIGELAKRIGAGKLPISLMNHHQHLDFLNTVGMPTFIEMVNAQEPPPVNWESRNRLQSLVEILSRDPDVIASWLQRERLSSDIATDPDYLRLIIAMLPQKALKDERIHALLQEQANTYFPLDNFDALATTQPNEEREVHIDGKPFPVMLSALKSCKFFRMLISGMEPLDHTPDRFSLLSDQLISLPTERFSATTWRDLLTVLNDSSPQHFLALPSRQRKLAVWKAASYCCVDNAILQRIEHAWARAVPVESIDSLVGLFELSRSHQLEQFGDTLLTRPDVKSMALRYYDYLEGYKQNPLVEKVREMAFERFVTRALDKDGPSRHHFKRAWETSEQDECRSLQEYLLAKVSSQTIEGAGLRGDVPSIWKKLGEMPTALYDIIKGN